MKVFSIERREDQKAGRNNTRRFIICDKCSIEIYVKKQDKTKIQ